MSKIFMEKISNSDMKYMVKHIFINISFLKYFFKIYSNFLPTKLRTINPFSKNVSLKEFPVLKIWFKQDMNVYPNFKSMKTWRKNWVEVGKIRLLFHGKTMNNGISWLKQKVCSYKDSRLRSFKLEYHYWRKLKSLV